MTTGTHLHVLIVGLGGVTRTFRHWPERVLACALVRRGHSVRAIGTRDSTRPALATRSDIIDGVVVDRVPSAYAPNGQLARALHKHPRPDIIHLMHPRNVLADQTTRWAVQHGIPTVYTWLGPFHDAYATPHRERPFEYAPTYERLAFTRRAYLRLLLLERNPRDALRNYRLHAPLYTATALAPCSTFEAHVMRQFGLTQPLTMVPLWIDVPFIAHTPLHTPTCAMPRPWLLFVGQLTPRKGYDVAIAALPTIIAAYPTASLLIVSGLNQAQQAEARQLAHQVGVAEHVHLLGYLPDTDLINLYRASDVLLFPTRYEGFGLPLLEAMAAECPIVTTDIPVVNEIVQHEQNGLLVAYSNAEALAQGAIRLLDDTSLRKQCIAGGNTTLRERYHEDRLIADIEQLYWQVIGGSIGKQSLKQSMPR